MDFEKFKKFLIKILYLPIWLTILLAVLAAAGLLVSFLVLPEFEILAYVVYVFSAYALTVLCVRIPAIVKGARKWAYSTRFGKRYFNDPQYRVSFSLNTSLVFNFAYAIFKIVSGAVLSSWWVWTIGIYYALLALMRFYLLRYTKKKSGKILFLKGSKKGGMALNTASETALATSAFAVESEETPKRTTAEQEEQTANAGLGHAQDRNLKEEFKKYRVCAYMLLVTAFVLSGLVVMMVVFDEGYTYSGWLIYAAAAYAFYSVVSAIFGIFKYRKILSPAFFAAKVVRFVTALVSILSLQTALLSEFGETVVYARAFNALTGGVVCFAIAALGVSMIARANRQIREYKRCRAETGETANEGI